MWLDQLLDESGFIDENDFTEIRPIGVVPFLIKTSPRSDLVGIKESILCHKSRMKQIWKPGSCGLWAMDGPELVVCMCPHNG